MKENVPDLIKKISKLIESGDFDQALSHIDQAVIADPNNPDLLTKQGIVLRALCRFEEDR